MLVNDPSIALTRPLTKLTFGHAARGPWGVAISLSGHGEGPFVELLARRFFSLFFFKGCHQLCTSNFLPLTRNNPEIKRIYQECWEADQSTTDSSDVFQPRASLL